MPAPTNISAATAIDIGTVFPVNLTQKVDDGTTVYTVWYKYTAQPGDDDIGIWGYGGVPNYGAFLTIWSGPVSALVPYLGGTPEPFEVPCVIPVIPGNTLYFKFQPSLNVGTSTPPATLILSFLKAPKVMSSNNLVLITEFQYDGDAALIDPINGGVVGYRRLLGPGDSAAMLPDGTFAVENGDSKKVDIWGPDYLHKASTPILALTGPYNPITTDRNATFFLGTGRNSPAAQMTIYKFDRTGTILDTWVFNPGTTAPSLMGMAVKRDLSIMYYGYLGTNEPIRAYDLVNRVVLPNFATLVGRNISKDMFTTADNSLFVSFFDDTLTRYSSLGAIIQNYTIQHKFDRMFLALDEQTIWVEPQTNTVATIQQMRISDGVILSTSDTPIFAEGQTLLPFSTNMPRFGVSNSCPLLIMSPTGGDWSGNGGVPPPHGKIVVTKASSPVSAINEVFNFTAGGGLSPTNFSLKDGQSQVFDNVLVGSGYTIDELINPNFGSNVEVSNDSLPHNITVADGETVIVAFTNTFIGPKSGIYYIKPNKTNDTLWTSIAVPGDEAGGKQIVAIPNPFWIH